MKTLPNTHSGPGLVDLQLNGYAGFNFNGDPRPWTLDQLHELRARLFRRGVSVVFPTLVTDDAASMVARAKRYAELVDADERIAALMPKLHIEGPFISPFDGPRGAHPKRYVALPEAIPDLFDRLTDASGGRIGVWTLAPELPGAIALIRRLRGAGVVAALGHCQPSNEIIAEAVEAGARLSTHLGNGSHQMLPRLDNYVYRQLAEDRLAASLVADGHHMPLTTLKNFVRAKTPARSILVTDAIHAAEMPPGRYDFGGRTVEVTPDGRCSHPGEWNLAGSVLTLDRAVINTFLHCDVTFEQAWAMASTQPAELTGLKPPASVTVAVSAEGFTAR